MNQERERFLIVVREHKKLLYKIIRSYCQDLEDQRDLEQEILIQIWRALKTFNNSVKLSTWIYRVALNVAISHYRKDSKRRDETVILEDSVLEIVDNDEITKELDANVVLLYNFIGSLDNLNKAIIILNLEGNSYKEISDILGISETNVGTKISRIRKILKDKFNEHYAT